MEKIIIFYWYSLNTLKKSCKIIFFNSLRHASEKSSEVSFIKMLTPILIKFHNQIEKVL